MSNKGFFFKQYTVYLPTIWTWLILLLFFGLIGFITIKQLAVFLAKQSPVDADVMVVEGWMDPYALKQAYQVFKDKHYRLLITTGGPEVRNFNDNFSNYAEQAAYYLKKLGLKESELVTLPTPASAQNRTFLSAVIVRKAFEQGNIPTTNAFNVFTADVHARRTHYLYTLAFQSKPAVIGIYSAKPERFTLSNWWQTSVGAKGVITEFIGWLYAYCCFNPPLINSHEEMWGQYQQESVS